MDKKRCLKSCYVSKKEAKRARKEINKSPKGYKITYVYYCDLCGFWHVTSQDVKKRNKPFWNKQKVK